MKSNLNLKQSINNLLIESDHEKATRILGETLRVIKQSTEILNASAEEQLNAVHALRDRKFNLKKIEADTKCSSCHRRSECLLIRFTLIMRSKVCPFISKVKNKHYSTLSPRVEIPESNQQWEDRLYTFIMSNEN